MKEVDDVQPENFKPNFNPQLVKNFSQIANNIKTKEYQLTDARPAGRFAGTAPEPRKGSQFLFFCVYVNKRILF